MAEERIDETAEGYYVRSGDVLEWRWKGSKAAPSTTVTTATAKPVAKKPARKSPKAKAKK